MRRIRPRSRYLRRIPSVTRDFTVTYGSVPRASRDFGEPDFTLDVGLEKRTVALCTIAYLFIIYSVRHVTFPSLLSVTI